MADSTFNDQELGNSTQRDIKKLRRIKDCACVQRTIVCTFILVVAGLMALITASFLIVKKNVRPIWFSRSCSLVQYYT